VSAHVYVGANVNINTTAINIGNSTVNTVINSTSIKYSNSTSNSELTSSSLYFNGEEVVIPLTTVTTTGTTTQILYYFPLATYRSAELLISVKDNSANGYHLTKILAIHDGGSIHTTEYATMYSNTSLITTSASVNATHGIINVTPSSASLTIKVKPSLIGV
jgi:hypothetical protein